MKSFNLSEWALSHRSFVWFLMVVAIVAGAMSYRKLGREEDPAFAIKTMVVQAVWPGATISDTLDQVTDRIEKELQQIGAVDYTKSYTTPGQATVFVNLRDTTPPQTIPWLFYQVRKRLGDIKGTFPQGCRARSSTTSSATSTATSTPSRRTGSRCASCGTTSRRSAPGSSRCRASARPRSSAPRTR